MATRRLLVCSIGNPGSYLGTRHSAGHTLIEALREELSFSRFDKDRSYGGEVSRNSYDDSITLFKSPSLMNVSGKPVKTAYQSFLRDLQGEEKNKALLVVIHDELEAPLGKLKVKNSGSAKGHNGLQSIMDTLQTKDFYRIGVGIGRPVSRDPDVVANYVLSKMSATEKKAVEGLTSQLVAALQKIAKS